MSKEPIPLFGEWQQEDYFNARLADLIYDEVLPLDYYARLAQLQIAIRRLEQYIIEIEDAEGGEA